MKIWKLKSQQRIGNQLVLGALCWAAHKHYNILGSGQSDMRTSQKKVTPA